MKKPYFQNETTEELHRYQAHLETMTIILHSAKRSYNDLAQDNTVKANGLLSIFLKKELDRRNKKS